MDNKTEWVQVGDLANGFASDANTLKYVDDLEGKTFDFYMENGWLIRHVFNSGSSLTWEILKGNGVGEKVTEAYTATSIREGVYFVDFIKSKEKATSVSLVMNLNSDNGTAIINRMPSKQETMRPAYQRVMDGDLLTPVDSVFVQFTMGTAYTQGRGHQHTDELIGKRVQYTYSQHESYEHVYLNQNYYTWQCLNGVEKGLADTDLCHYYKIDEELYLFVWREKIIPTAGVIMIDLKCLKTTGKIVGYDGTDFEKLNNFPVGAYAKLLNETKHII
ncbi:molybdenum cofactor biosynthesis F family protein [Psychromonas arctica]|uniref:molybdenum cofactor biosynthesis F family protein n=1 Tax=Psychromonas arctica TaxID=168275 RepID=UPI0003F63E67|nr:molybdenum cofactor biosynthesis F family protein [Psychromonas arctica]